MAQIVKLLKAVAFNSPQDEAILEPDKLQLEQFLTKFVIVFTESGEDKLAFTDPNYDWNKDHRLTTVCVKNVCVCLYDQF